jgi:hypothetical protein
VIRAICRGGGRPAARGKGQGTKHSLDGWRPQRRADGSFGVDPAFRRPQSRMARRSRFAHSAGCLLLSEARTRHSLTGATVVHDAAKAQGLAALSPTIVLSSWDRSVAGAGAGAGACAGACA